MKINLSKIALYVPIILIGLSLFGCIMIAVWELNKDWYKLFISIGSFSFLVIIFRVVIMGLRGDLN